MKPHQRIALTKARVHRALIELLSRQEINRISIRKLCAIAGINRTTFYNHYASQFDVLSEIRDWYLSDVAQAIESADPKDRDSVPSRVTLVLAYMEKNIDISRLLMQTNIDETFAARLFSLPKIEELLCQSMNEAVNRADYRDVVSFAIYGSYKLIQNWIAANERRSPDEMAALILSLASAVCLREDS